MSPDYANHAMVDFDDYLVWGEVDGKRFKVRVKGDSELGTLLEKQRSQLRKLLLSMGREAA